MRIEEALRSCRGIPDCPALVEALGGAPRFVPLSPALFGSGVGAAADIGRLGPLPCLAVTCDTVDRVARRLARSSMTRGEPSLVFALGEVEGSLTLAIGEGPSSVLAVDTGAPDGVALAALRRLRAVNSGGRISVALRIADILAGQRVDRRFFESFRTVRDRFAEEGPKEAPAGDRRALALLHLTRVLFLYFVQQKGWLDGRDDFLARAVDDHLGRRREVDRDLLRPLFFGTLNRPEVSRGRAVRRFGRIPFLNGGLFEPHLLERRWPVRRTNAAWRIAFDDLFEHFHFTLKDDDGRSIAPDMLGRVFEGLMAADERRATGTFYTPARLVTSVVTAGVASLIAERLGIGVDVAEGLIDRRDPSAGQVLARCRALDPAVGSGAFLLGALDLFANLATARDPVPGHRRRILKSQLFGVDLSAEAVRLAELRLWLSAVQDDPDGPEVEVEPLPNLDAALRQGDSLHDPRWLNGVRRIPAASARSLAEARRLFAAESGAGKPTAWRALQAAERSAAAESMRLATADLDHRIEVILGDARTRDLFGERRGLDAILRPRLREAREDRRRVVGAARRLAREGSLPWFDAPSAFGEVFAQSGGFDLVMGNPPWVRGERVPARTRAHLAERYRWWRGERGPFAHRPDLAVAFLERSLELTAPGGVVAMLVPAKLATASYATTARRALVAETSLDRAVDLTSEEATAFAAVTYPMALVTRKRPPREDHQVGVKLTGPGSAPSASFSGGPWILRAPDAARVATAIGAAHAAVGGTFAIHLGVKSGCNAAYLRPPDTVEPRLVRQAVRGRDLRPFTIHRSIPLLYPHDRSGRPRRDLPPGALGHLTPFRPRLESRTDAGSGPWWGLHRTTPASADHRVAWADLARRLAAVALPDGVVPLNSCYFAITPSAEAMHALTAWLNATWCRAIVALGTDPARGGYHRFNARAVGRAPWVAAATSDRALLAAARAAAQGKEMADDIDDLVGDHLGLDARDRRALRAVA